MTKASPGRPRGTQSRTPPRGSRRHAPLPARLEEGGHDVDGLGSRAGALEAEPDQVHADQGRRGGRRVVGRGHAFVADGDAVLVHAVLGAPEPGRTRQERGVRAGVADAQVLRAQRAPGGCPPAERPGDLGLAGRAVRVLGEHHAGGPPARTGCRTWSQCRDVDRVGRMEPHAVLTADEIDLSDMEFWARPWDEREGAFQTLRRERPMPFFEEPEIPEALSFMVHRGPGLLRVDAPRRHLGGEPASRDLPVRARAPRP